MAVGDVATVSTGEISRADRSLSGVSALSADRQNDHRLPQRINPNNGLGTRIAAWQAMAKV